MFDFLKECCIPYKKGYVFLDDVRIAFRAYAPGKDHWSPKRITQALKKAGCEIQDTSRKGQKGNFLFGYVLNDRYKTDKTVQYDSPKKNKQEDDF